MSQTSSANTIKKKTAYTFSVNTTAVCLDTCTCPRKIHVNIYVTDQKCTKKHTFMFFFVLRGIDKVSNIAYLLACAPC